jgi:hypothetical protein
VLAEPKLVRNSEEVNKFPSSFGENNIFRFHRRNSDTIIVDGTISNNWSGIVTTIDSICFLGPTIDVAGMGSISREG